MTRRSYFGNFAAGVMPISLPALANAQENTTGNQHPDATPDLTGFGVKGDGNTDITNGEFVSMH